MKTETQIDGKLTLIKGTQGGFDYALIDTREGFALGIKPLVQIESSASSFAFRVRAIPYITEEDNTIQATFGDADVVVQKMLAAYSGLSFSKIDAERASTVGTISVQIGRHQPDKLLNWITTTDVAGKVLSSVAEAAGITDVPYQPEVLAFLNRIYLEKTKEIVGQVAEAQKADVSTDVVVDFPGAKPLDMDDLNAEAEDLGQAEDPEFS